MHLYIINMRHAELVIMYALYVLATGTHLEFYIIAKCIMLY